MILPPVIVQKKKWLRPQHLHDSAYLSACTPATPQLSAYHHPSFIFPCQSLPSTSERIPYQSTELL